MAKNTHGEDELALFSRAYLKEPSTLRDSGPFWRRLFRWFRQNVFDDSELLNFSDKVTEELRLLLLKPHTHVRVRSRPK
jgi:hypothetical protein